MKKGDSVLVNISSLIGYIKGVILEVTGPEIIVKSDTGQFIKTHQPWCVHP